MRESTFGALHSRRIAAEICRSERRVVYAAPGLDTHIAESIRLFRDRSQGTIEIVLDCNENVFRLGYGQVEAVRALVDEGVRVRQAPGIRIGLLICDDRAWCFSPVALCVEDQPQTEETPNAVAILREQAEDFLQAICPSDHPSGLFCSDAIPEVGSARLTERELEEVEAGLEVAPPGMFDVERQVRVFLPYLQYVELSLEGCSITRHTVQLPKSILNLAPNEDLQARIKTTYNLIDRGSEVSDRQLQDELRCLREIFTSQLRKPWGRMILKSARKAFDKAIEEFQGKVRGHQEQVKAKLGGEIEKSKNQLVEACIRTVMSNVPPELKYKISGAAPTEEQARQWLRRQLDACFPKPESLIKEMKLEWQFKDVTYDTLTQPGFADSLREAFPDENWEKPFEEFEAARSRDEQITEDAADVGCP